MANAFGLTALHILFARYHFSRGADTMTAAVEAMYVMLRSKLRQPHYYGMVKLLELDSTQRTAEEIAVDAYELFGEGRNWCVSICAWSHWEMLVLWWLLWLLTCTWLFLARSLALTPT